MRFLFNIILFLLIANYTFANVSQSTINIFAPNNDQTIFTQVERSKVNDKKYFNTVLFFDMASQSQALFSNPDLDTDDVLSFIHLGISYGLTKRLEVGGRFPILFNQSISDTQLGSSLELTGTGFTNIVGYLKYNLIKGESYGISALAQAGLANSDLNFYVGDGPGPNLNLSLLFDKPFGSWNFGLNLGYLTRSPGDRGPSYLFFEPIESTLQGSIGLSKILSEKSRLSLELAYNSHDYEIDTSDREKDGIEAFLNYRRQFKKIKFIIGGGFGLNDGLAVPAFRGFLGLNYRFTFKSDTNGAKEVSVEPISQVEEESEPPVSVEEDVATEDKEVTPKSIEQTVIIDKEDEVFDKLTEFDKKNNGVKADYQKITLNYVEFEFNSYTLNAKSKKTLEDTAKYLRSGDFKTLEVIGHTDFYGSTAYNEILSLKRAKSVMNFFLSKGIDKAKMSFNGYGKRRPVNTGTTEEMRQKNRRVEILLRNN